MRRLLVVVILLLSASFVSRGQDYIVEAFISDETPYVGEQILYGFRYYTYTTPAGIFDQLPDFEGFWLTDVYELAGGRVETIDNRQYIVNEVYAEISPVTAGEITIEPAQLEIPETVFGPAQTLVTDPITIDVLPLPAGAPPGFNGAVGQFNATVSLNETRITLGQPVTLTMTVDGTGNLEQLPAPNLPEPPNWRIFTNPARYVTSAIGGLRFGQKVFEWLLIPEQAGSQQFPAFEFVFFDPEQTDYQSITFEGFTVEVFPGADNARALPTAQPDRETAILPIKPVPGSLQPASGVPNAIFWLLWLLAPVITLVVGGTLALRTYQRRQRLYLRRSRALRQALRRLQAARTMETRVGSQQIYQAMQRYLRDKSGGNQPQAADHIADETLLGRLQTILAQAEGKQYVPVGHSEDLSPLVKAAAEALTQVDRQWS